MRYTKVKTEQDVEDWYNYLVENGMDGNVSTSCYGWGVVQGEDDMESIESRRDFYQDEDGYFLIDERLYFCCKYGDAQERIDIFTDYIPLRFNSNRYNL